MRAHDGDFQDDEGTPGPEPYDGPLPCEHYRPHPELAGLNGVPFCVCGFELRQHARRTPPTRGSSLTDDEVDALSRRLLDRLLEHGRLLRFGSDTFKAAHPELRDLPW